MLPGLRMVSASLNTEPPRFNNVWFAWYDGSKYGVGAAPARCAGAIMRSCAVLASLSSDAMQRCLIVRCLAAVCLTAMPAAAPAQSDGQGGDKTARIARTDIAPVIDGILEQAVWGGAPQVDDFHQITPIEYDEPTEVTRVYLLYDSTHLYVGARLLDSGAENIVAQILRQGAEVESDDYFGVILDPFLDRRNGYLFAVNPNGVRSEALFKYTSQTDYDWAGIWRAQASVDEQGWTVEMAIPFNTLSFDPDADSWGINFTRFIARNQETVGWVSRTRDQNPSIAGTVTGFRGLEQGLGLDIVPSLTLRQSRHFIPVGEESFSEPSLDVFYKLTPALTGVLTLNTDFSAAEVDDRQVNLTRFGLLFPEKRNFFLQDADIFEFARLAPPEFTTPDNNVGNQNGRPFFSRTIGLSESRQPVDVEAGAKLTGRVGRWNLGVINIRQAEYESVEASNLFVGRAVANVLGESNLGVIVTDGDPHSNLDNRVAGVDFRYLNSHLPGGRTAEGDVWYQRSATPGLDGDQAAFGAGYKIRSPDKWDGEIRYIQLGEHFHPALGFANRVGVRDLFGEVRYVERPRGRFYRSTFYIASYERNERLADGGLQSEAIYLRFGLVSHGNDRLFLTCSRETEGLIRPFVINRARDAGENVVIPAGEYSFDSCRLYARSGDQRRLSGRVSYQWGDFYDGRRVIVRPSIVWRPSRHFAVDFQYQLADVELPYGAFTSRLSRLRTDIVFSSVLSWVNLLQWDNDTDELGMNSRLHWVPRAGREVYLVLNYNFQDYDEDGTFESMDTDLTAKLNYTFRF